MIRNHYWVEFNSGQRQTRLIKAIVQRKVRVRFYESSHRWWNKVVSPLPLTHAKSGVCLHPSATLLDFARLCSIMFCFAQFRWRRQRNPLARKFIRVWLCLLLTHVGHYYYSYGNVWLAGCDTNYWIISRSMWLVKGDVPCKTYTCWFRSTRSCEFRDHFEGYTTCSCVDSSGKLWGLSRTIADQGGGFYSRFQVQIV